LHTGDAIVAQNTGDIYVASGSHAAEEVFVPKVRILIVEDNETLGKRTKSFLETRGHQVTWIPEGMPAIRLAKEGQVDMILLDRLLPDIDGIRICHLLKQDEETRDIPIIMLTAMDKTEDKVRGLEAGADDYLPKPFEDVELNARVSAALRTKLLKDELKRKNDELQKMLVEVETLSMTDSLTGLFNRRRFEGVLDAEFKKSYRYNLPLTCMMVDIDHFKSVNDTYGHAVGDGVITSIARIIKRSIRESDAACRWGGEEFVILAPMTNKDEASLPAKRILHAVETTVFAGMGSEKRTVSIGVAAVPAEGIDTPDKLIQAADAALYEAKKKGRNRVEVKG
jgi:two-component system cell cycle response regulator